MNINLSAFSKVLILHGVVLLLIRTAGLAQSPDSRISGKVYDEKHQALTYASVTLLKGKDSSAFRSTLSSDSGVYEFNKVPYGSYWVSVSVSGFEAVTQGPFVINESK